MLLLVTLDVEGGDSEEVGLVPEESETVVAPLAEQLSDAARGVIMIKVLRRRGVTDSATVVLSGSEF